MLQSHNKITHARTYARTAKRGAMLQEVPGRKEVTLEIWSAGQRWIITQRSCRDEFSRIQQEAGCNHGYRPGLLSHGKVATRAAVVLLT